MFFEGIKTREELKKAYKRLCMEHHPDHGGDEATMKAINAEFERVFKTLRDVQHAKAEAAADEDEEIPADFMDIVSKLTVIEDVDVEIVGTWVWVGGNTYQAKERLKEAGCKWSKSRKMWYWHREGQGRHRSSKCSMDAIRARYGSREVKGAARPKLED